MRKIVLAALAASAITTTGNAATFAQLISNIDQQNTSGSGQDGPFFSGAGQSFTAGQSLFNAGAFNLIGNNATAQATLYQGDGLTGTSLGVSNIVAIADGTYDNYLFSFSDITLNVGSAYTLFVRAITGSVGESFSGGSTYAGGAAFTGVGDRVADSDDYFAVGNNSPTLSVPEPATWAMMVGGFGLVGAGMRRRRTAVSFA